MGLPQSSGTGVISPVLSRVDYPCWELTRLLLQWHQFGSASGIWKHRLCVCVPGQGIHVGGHQFRDLITSTLQTFSLLGGCLQHGVQLVCVTYDFVYVRCSHLIFDP